MKQTVIASIALAGSLAIAAPMLASAQSPGSSPPPAPTAPPPAADQALPPRPGMEHGMFGRSPMGGMMGRDMMGRGMMAEHMMDWRHHHEERMGRHGWMRHERRWARSPAERCNERLARRAGMVAYTVTRLDLTATQRPLWDKLNAVLEAGTAKEQQLCSALATAWRKGGETILDRTDRREKFLSARLDTLHQARPLLEQLYQTLSPEQKAIINHPFQHG